jgi:hypothetical protein
MGFAIEGASPHDGVSLAGHFDGDVQIQNGHLELDFLPLGGSNQLCFTDMPQEVAKCSSSIRYKEQVTSFTTGLDLVQRLRPVAFRWKAGGRRDLGLIAEEVVAVEPLLVTFDSNGEIDGVKYDRLSAVLINAMKEQQAEIERQREQIQALAALVCRSHADADVCR